jgi:hypothetical protein
LRILASGDRTGRGGVNAEQPRGGAERRTDGRAERTSLSLNPERIKEQTMRQIFGVAAAAVLTSGLTLAAQTTTQVHPGTAGSPHVRTQWTIDGAQIAIEYGRPYLKGRPEAQLMPPGQPWRTGADEATTLTTNKALTFGTLKLEPGTYTLNTIPGQQWQLLVGKLEKPGQWGIPYNASLEIGRVPMTTGKTAAPVEQVTFAIDDTPAGATLRIEWGTTSASVPFTVAP